MFASFRALAHPSSTFFENKKIGQNLRNRREINIVTTQLLTIFGEISTTCGDPSRVCPPARRDGTFRLERRSPTRRVARGEAPATSDSLPARARDHGMPGGIFRNGAHPEGPQPVVYPQRRTSSRQGDFPAGFVRGLVAPKLPRVGGLSRRSFGAKAEEKNLSGPSRSQAVQGVPTRTARLPSSPQFLLLPFAFLIGRTPHRLWLQLGHPTTTHGKKSPSPDTRQYANARQFLCRVLPLNNSLIAAYSNSMPHKITRPAAPVGRSSG
jgi:hypothetical protein